jgi:hypothetical protein
MSKITPKKRVLFVRRVTPVALALFGVFSMVALNLRAAPVAHAVAVNSTVNFQARLQTAAGAIVPDDSYNIQFKLYDVSTGGTALWTETYLNSSSKGLSTVNGYLSTQLGSVTSFPSNIPWGHQLWITMNIGGTGGSASWDGEMNPRLQLTAIPYAFEAGSLTQDNSDSSLTSTLAIQAPTGGNQNFVIQDQGAAGTYDLLTKNQGDADYIKLQTGSPSAQTGNISITGSVSSASVSTNSIDRSSSGTLTIGSTNSTSINVGNTSSNTATTINGTTTVKTTSGNDSATAFQVQKAAGGAPVFDVDTANGRVGVGTATPGRTLDIAVSSSNTTTGTTMARLVQGGSGDATMELATASSNYYIGIDESAGGAFKISSAAASDPTHTGTADAFTKSLFTLTNTGAVTFQNSTNSTNALQVTNALGTASVFDVDTTNTRVGIGTNAPSRTFDVSVNTSAVNAPPVLVEQGGTGDASIEFKNGSTSFYVGQDTSNSGAFSINSSGAAASGSSLSYVQSTQLSNGGSSNTSVLTLGSVGSGHLVVVGFAWTHATNDTPTCSDTLGSTYTTYGFNASGTNEYFESCYAITSASGSDTITVQFGSASVAFRQAVAAEYSGVDTTNPLDTSATTDANPQSGSGTDNMVAHSATTSSSGDLIVGLFESTHGNGNVTTAGTGYTRRAVANVYELSLEDRKQASAGSVTATMTLDSSGIFYEGAMLAFRAATGGTVSDTYSNSLFTLSQDGAANFRNSSDSGTAFRVQNASSASMFNVDTVNEKVTIGPSAGDTTGALLILGNKTSSGDPTEVDGAMYYNSNVGSFRCGVAGAWESCIGGLLSVSSGAGITDGNKVTETTISPTYTLPANYCANNRVLRVTANGTYTTTATPTLTFKIKLGTVAITPDNTTMTTQGTAKGWQMNFTIICPNAAGGSGSAVANIQGMLTMANDANRQIAYSSNAIATNTTQALSISATWGIANASNSVTLNSFTLEGMGP